jgi:putative transposase
MFHIRAGKVYFSPIIDCLKGLVISWAIGTYPDTNLVNTMLDATVETIADSEARPIIHSDRGEHYRWPGWLERTSQQSSFVRCHERRDRKTMPHAKASSVA